MIETPGTALLTIGMLILVVSILVGAFGHWLAALALFAISIILLFFAVQLRGHESRAAAQSTEIREREIVKVKCRYCGALNPDGARNCSACGAML
jgi:ribosomal protein L40E